MNAQTQVLLLEDDEFDVVVLQRSIKAAKIELDLQVASDGEEALQKLGLMQGPKPQALPNIAVLDINVPRISGIDVCAHIRQQPSLANLHVVFFTGSRSKQDEAQAWRAGADAYFDKNTGPQALLEHIQKLSPRAL